MLVPLPCLHFIVPSCCILSTLSFTHFLSQRGLGPGCCVGFQCCKRRKRDMDLDHRIALGMHGFILFFLFLFSTCVGQCKLQIGGVLETAVATAALGYLSLENAIL